MRERLGGNSVGDVSAVQRENLSSNSKGLCKAGHGGVGLEHHQHQSDECRLASRTS